MPSAAPTRRRKLHFATVDEVMADVDKFHQAEQRGTLGSCGNWTLGQSLNHLATWVDYSYQGVPIKIPTFVRWLARPIKKRFLTRPMKPGSKIPNVPGGTLGIEVVPTAMGLAHLRETFTQLGKAPPMIPHALFGPMTHDEWIARHLRTRNCICLFCRQSNMPHSNDPIHGRTSQPRADSAADLLPTAGSPHRHRA
jgi:hypothetical protein